MARPKGSKNKPKDPNIAPKARKVSAKPRAEKTKREAAKPPVSSPNSAVQFRKPNAEELLRLVKQVTARSAEQKNIGMASKELVDKLAETRGLDKKAFGIVRGLYRMSEDNPEKLAITLPHLLSYIDDLKLAEKADKARGLEINGEDDDQTDLEDAIEDAPEAEEAPQTTAEAMAEAIAADTAGETTGAETAEWPDDQQVATTRRLSIVPGPNAPVAESEVPTAPDAEDEHKSDAA